MRFSPVAVVLRALPLALMLPAWAGAAELTDVIDAADGDDPYDANVEIIYSRTLRRAKITREYNCDPANRDQDRDTCPDAFNRGEGTMIHVKELRYERTIHTVTPRFRLGIWHDLELRIDMPIVASDKQSYRFAGDGGDKTSQVITPENSSIAPGPDPNGIDPENLFNVPSDGTGIPERAGFGDMELRFRYGPFQEERDASRASWVVELGYRIPTGEVMKVGNEGVGRGVHELTVATGVSRRFTYLDPYTYFFATFPFPGSGSLFDDFKNAQQEVGPGNRGGFDLGMEIHPYENPRYDVRFWIDLGLGATYQAEGRDYTELFDALALGAQTCDRSGPEGNVNCAFYNPDSGTTLADQPHDGITTVEQYMTVKGRLGFGLQASKYFKLGVNLALAHETEHYLSQADIGLDRNGTGQVEGRSSPKYDPAEHNPTYVPAIDELGRRLRIEETTVFSVGVHASGMF